MPTSAENGFDPELPKGKVDLIYLCSPNNPTGALMSRASLEKWVKYAKENEAVILFDAAYEAFITEPGQVHSIYEIPGAREVAIEFRSLSKTAGFTGTRCAYTVVPKDIMARNDKGETVALHGLWNRRQTTKFNGVSYPIQRAAAAIFSEAGAKAVRDNIKYYMENARIIREGLKSAGYTVYGGVNAPLYLAEGARQAHFLEFLRQIAAGSQCGRHAGIGIRHPWRRLFPPERLRHPGKRSGGGGAHQKPRSSVRAGRSGGQFR